MDSFRLTGLDEAQFEHFFEQSDAELQQQDIRRVVATEDTGFPCRVSLRDASAGDELLLLPWRHHDVDSPYRALGAIYVRKGATRPCLPPGVVPDYVLRRLISLRAYDAGGMMTAADVREGPEVGAAIEGMFADEAIAYIHLHNARPGCFSCVATRAPAEPPPL